MRQSGSLRQASQRYGGFAHTHSAVGMNWYEVLVVLAFVLVRL